MEEEQTDLKRFFNDVLEQKRLKKALPKTPSSGKRKPLQYQVTPDEFQLINVYSKDVISSQPRNPQIHIDDTLRMYDKTLREISKELLDIKYSYLFEYRPMELYATEMETKIVPKEAEYDEIEKQKNDLASKVKNVEDEYHKTVQEIKLTQQTYREELKELDSADELERRETMRQYILLDKKLFMMKKTHKKMIELNQSTSKKKKPISIEVTNIAENIAQNIAQSVLPRVIVPTINNNVVKKRLSQTPIAEEKEELNKENRYEEKKLPDSSEIVEDPLNNSPEPLENI
jgi:tetrahydromethanopterin S-methyltransferase subunit G